MRTEVGHQTLLTDLDDEQSQGCGCVGTMKATRIS